MSAEAPARDFRGERDAVLLTLEHQKEAAVRVDAAASLCELAFEAPASERELFVPDVVRLLSDPMDEVRCAALALAAIVLPPGEAREVLTRHLADKVTRVRVEAAGRLADLSLPDARGALAAALQDSSPQVRFEGARGMAFLGHPAGLEVLTAALADPELRFRAAGALAKLQSREAIEPLRKAFSGWFLPEFDKTQLAGALAALGDAEGVAHLFKRAGKKWTMDRAMAVELLGEVRAAGAKERLLEIAGDPEDPARGAAFRALGRLGDASVEGRLTELLGERLLPDDLKLDLAEGLLLLGTPSALATVKALTLSDAACKAELAALLAEVDAP
jgi:HEAT repeat protein